MQNQLRPHGFLSAKTFALLPQLKFFAKEAVFVFRTDHCGGSKYKVTTKGQEVTVILIGDYGVPFRSKLCY